MKLIPSRQPKVSEAARQTCRGQRQTLARLLLTAACCLGLVMLQGCQCGQNDAQQAAQKLLQALVKRDASLLPAGMLRGKVTHNEVAAAVHGPLVFFAADVVKVNTVGTGKQETYEVEYRAQVSDYPSSLFNCLAKDQVLQTQAGTLAPYQKQTTLVGRLHLICQDRQITFQERPGSGDPLFMAIEMAVSRQKWLQYLATGPTGPAAAGRFLRLLNLTDFNALSGQTSREQTLKAVAATVRSVKVQAPGALLRAELLGNEGDLADSLEALAAADKFLHAWWKGAPETEARIFYASMTPYGDYHRSRPQDLASSPVRLRGYEITEMVKDDSGRYTLHTKMQVSDPDSVLAVTVCAPDLRNPREQISFIDEGITVEDTFRLARTGSEWVLLADSHQGVLGYLIMGAKAVDELAKRKSTVNLIRTNDVDKKFQELFLRLIFIEITYSGLDFPPLWPEGMKQAGLEPHFKPVVELVMKLTEEMLPLAGFSDAELAFYLGMKLADYNLGHNLSKAKLVEPEKLAKELQRAKELCNLLFKGLDLSVTYKKDIDAVMADLTTKNIGDIALYTIPVSNMVRQRHGARFEAIFQVGRDMYVLGELVRLQGIRDKIFGARNGGKPLTSEQIRQDVDTLVELNVNIFFRLARLDENLRLAGARPEALAAIENWKRNVIDIKNLPAKEVEEMSKFKALFVEEEK